MSTLDLLPVVFVGATALLAVLVAMRTGITHGRGGKITAFFALFLLPALSLWAGYSSQMEHATSTKFCLSCHVMEDFGRSLYVDDPSYIPAAHFQNNRVPRDHACYTCHTDYTLFWNAAFQASRRAPHVRAVSGDDSGARSHSPLHAVQQPRVPPLP